MSPYALWCEAHQRPIGQGGFYSAAIKHSNLKDYTLVYDCGSLTDSGRLSDEISEFSREIGNRPLDLLVLSHLDADHVNGVDELLRATGGVADVFLPYLSPLERLIYAIRFRGEGHAYLDLLADPVRFLQDRGAQRVFLVGHSGDDADANRDGNPEGGLPENLREPFKLDTQALDDDSHLAEAYEAETGAKPSGGVRCVSDSRSVSLSRVWKLRFFQKEGLRHHINALLNPDNSTTSLSADPDYKRCENFIARLQRELGGASLSNHDILSLIRSPEKLKAVRSAYEELAGCHNEVSLCLWHGPVEFNGFAPESRVHGFHASAILWPADSFYRPYLSRYSQFYDRGGTVLTGDIKLKGATLEKFKRHYAADLPDTAFIQIPHHGARGNLSLSSSLFTADRLLFLSAGLRNQYLHPHLDMIEEIEYRYEVPVLWSTERRGVSFTIGLD